MTLALETIKSLPIPPFEVKHELVEALVHSEGSNKVYKMNAGALHENVKHSLALVAELNKLIVPKFSEALILTHQNSELAQISKA